MNYKTLLLIIPCILFNIQLSAQNDSSYIVPFDQDFAVQLYTQNKFVWLSEIDSDQKSTNYRSNKPVNIGAGFSWRNISLSGAYGLNFLADKSKGKTESFDFQYHRYHSKYVWDVYLLVYKGLYNNDEGITLHPSIKVSQLGSFAQYVFNNTKFSYRATFGQRERQVKSAGSWLLGGGLYYNTLESYTSRAFIEPLNLKTFQLGVSVGYAYSWVIKKDFYISGSMSGGISIGNTNETFSFDELSVYPNYVARMATGYNGDDWSIGTSYMINSMQIIRTDNHHVMLNTGNAQFSFIKRFCSETIFGKRNKQINNIHSRISSFIP